MKKGARNRCAFFFGFNARSSQPLRPSPPAGSRKLPLDSRWSGFGLALAERLLSQRRRSHEAAEPH